MTVRLSAPVGESEARALDLGETVYVDGIIYTLRDAQHIRAQEYYRKNRSLPVDLSDQIIYHCAPSYRETSDGYEILAAGPTTSERSNFFAPTLIEEFKPRVLVGKGGMDKETHTAMVDHGCAYLTVPSVSALIIDSIESVEARYWEDLDSESIWVFRMNRFGPLTVTMDAHGNDIRDQNQDDSFGTTYES